MVRQIHDGMQARVQSDGELYEPFEVTHEVKQGCVMATTMFSMMVSAMLMDASRDGCFSGQGQWFSNQVPF